MGVSGGEGGGAELCWHGINDVWQLVEGWGGGRAELDKVAGHWSFSDYFSDYFSE